LIRLSWLHSLKSWSLRQTRGGSIPAVLYVFAFAKNWSFSWVVTIARWVGKVTRVVGIECLDILKRAFLSNPLWQTTILMILTMVCLGLLVITISLHLKPALAIILTNPSVLMDIFSSSLLWANLQLFVSMFTAAVLMFVLFYAWLPRGNLTAARLYGESRLGTSVGVLYLCGIASSFLYHCIGLALSYHDWKLLIPGPYTLLPIFLAFVHQPSTSKAH
jgi:membrane-associated HD superfamily phosphohydrolase